MIIRDPIPNNTILNLFVSLFGRRNESVGTRTLDGDSQEWGGGGGGVGFCFVFNSFWSKHNLILWQENNYGGNRKSRVDMVLQT